jgi:hypothetical protein
MQPPYVHMTYSIPGRMFPLIEQDLSEYTSLIAQNGKTDGFKRIQSLSKELIASIWSARKRG